MFYQKIDFWVRKMYLKAHFEREFSIFTEYPPSSPYPPLKRVLGISQQSHLFPSPFQGGLRQG